VRGFWILDFGFSIGAGCRSIITALTASILLLTTATAYAQKPDLSTPEKTVRSFVAALNQGDLNWMTRCVLGGKLDPALASDLQRQMKASPVTFTIGSLKVESKGNSATVSVQTIARERKSGRENSFSDRVTLRRMGAEWKIVPADPRTMNMARNAQPGLITAFSIGLANPQVFAVAREKARATSCLSNVKQICMGALMFLQDNDEKFALQTDGYKAKLMPYIKNEKVFHCPSDKSGAVSYSFNENLQGVSLAAIQHPTETVMIYEGRNGKLVFRHEGKAAAGFVDGHVKTISEQAAKNLRWKP
jgi:prepilin-type processing-associated H-X9-DG protein